MEEIDIRLKFHVELDIDRQCYLSHKHLKANVRKGCSLLVKQRHGYMEGLIVKVYQNDAMHPIGINLRNERNRCSMAVVDLSAVSGISFETIYRIENLTRVEVSESEINAIAGAIGIDPEILLEPAPVVKGLSSYQPARISRPII